MFESSVEQTIIKSVDAAVIAAAPGPDWPLPLFIPSLVFFRLFGIFHLDLITRGFQNYYQLLNKIALPADQVCCIVAVTSNSARDINAVCWVSSFKISYV
jgi:hypothetical protein